MKYKSIGLALFVAATLNGCAIPQTPKTEVIPRIAFPAAEYAALPTTGTGSVTGQVFMQTIGGDVKYGAGSMVYLMPVTSYTEQWYSFSYLGGKPIAAADPRSKQGQLVTQADGTGSFSFSNVPPGQYFLSSSVWWQAPSRYGLLPQGGVIAEQITVKNDAEVKKILTK